MKVIAIMGGGDWFDASVDHLVLLEEQKTMDSLKTDYNSWYYKEFLPNRKTVRYMTFPEWLLEKGYARKTADDELEEYWDK